MTIIEAIKSGKPFKRAHLDTWIVAEINDVGLDISGRDILAEDWIVKDPREFYINIYPGDTHSDGWSSKELADKAAGRNRIECILVREVLEGEKWFTTTRN